jgi:hypothetical protein
MAIASGRFTNIVVKSLSTVIPAMTLSLLGGFIARAQAPLQETISVTIGDNGHIDNSFLGFHYEKQIMQGTMFRTTNTNLINIYHKLLGHKGTLRMGGNTNDTTYWCGIAPPGNGTLSDCITSGDVDEFAAFVKAIGWRVIYDVNEKSIPVTTYLPLSVAEAQYATRALGSNLWGFEYGNEPANTSTYFTNWNNFYDALGPDATYIGPAGANFTLNSPFAMMDGSRAALLTSHYYISGGTAPGITVDTMLASLDPGSTTLTTLQNNCASAVDLAKAYVGGTHRWRNAEANNYSGGGASGISNTFASSLWVLEYLFTIAQCGGQGVDIVNDVFDNNTFGYVPIYAGVPGGTNILVNNGPNVVEIRPEFYGLALWERIANGTIENATQMGLAGNGFHSYAINEDDGSYAVVLANNSETDTIEATVTLPRQYVGASYMTLTAPALDSTAPNVTLGGSDIGVDGSWAPRMRLLPMTMSGQAVRVTVNPASAVWVNLTNNTVLTGRIVSKFGGHGSHDIRQLKIGVTNNSTEPVTASQIDDFILTQTHGSPCTPVILGSVPVSMGDIAAGGTTNGDISIDFTACAADAHFSLNALFSANGGSATGVVVDNQAR